MTLQQNAIIPIDVKFKAVLSNRIYLSSTDALNKSLRNQLTYMIPSKIFGNPPEEKTTFKKAGPNVASLPIGRLDLIPSNYSIIDKRSVVPVEFPDFKFTLRPEQDLIYQAVDDNCLINANASWGKTFTGIAIATKLGQKTLIIVHTLFLLEQWKEEIQKTLGITPGIISGGTIKNGLSPITVGNIQTLRKYALSLKDKFGLIILDEVHHAPAKEFEVTLNIFRARYKIGLSATLTRKDMLHVVLPDYFGKKIYKPPKANQMKPDILMINSGIPFSSNMMVPWATKVNELVNRPEFLKLISDLSFSYSEAGYKVLTVSDRTEFLKSLYELHPDMSIMVIGPTIDREILRDHMEESKTTNICYGALSIFKEGVSWDFLSCLIIAAPVNNNPLLEQLIGRIQRIYPNKPTPIVVDIILKGGTAKRQAQGRAAFYINQGYRVSWVDIT